MRSDVSSGSNVPKASYLGARRISFLLRLSPNGCTKEHKNSPFTQTCKSISPGFAVTLNPNLLCVNV